MSDTTVLLAALAVERRGYEVRGLDDRIAEVDAQVARLRKESGQPADAAPTKRAGRKTS